MIKDDSMPTDLTDMSLEQLQQHQEALQTQLNIEWLREELRVADLSSRYVQEAQGDLVDPNDALFDGVGMSRFQELDPSRAPISMPTDRKRGDNWPVWRTEQEHAQIRGICRLLSYIDEVAISAGENLVNYCIGKDGLDYSVTPKAKAPKESDRQMALAVQAALEKFLDRNDIEAECDREEFGRLHRDGEDFMGLWREPIPRYQIIDPAFVTEPGSPRALEDGMRWRKDMLDWKYGLATTWRDTSRPLFCFLAWYGDNAETECLREGCFVHAKVNVDREVKRGLSSYFPVWRNLLNAGKLLHNTIQGAAIQAAIAYIRNHAPAVRHDEIEAFAAKAATRVTERKTRNAGTYSQYERRATPGMIIDTPNGAQIQAGPMGTLRQPVYIEVVQAALRLVGVRFQQPEYMISGDASNANYSSTLVSEAPFTKSSEAKQGVFCSRRRALCLKAIRIMCEFGTIPYPYHIVRQIVDVVVTGPPVAVRDRAKDSERYQREFDAGIRSPQTWAEDADLDWEEEQRRGAAPQQTTPSPGQFAEAWRYYP